MAEAVGAIVFNTLNSRWLSASDISDALGDAFAILEAALRDHPLGAGAAAIGRVEARSDGGAGVILRTIIGGERPLDLLSGMDLPRIC